MTLGATTAPVGDRQGGGATSQTEAPVARLGYVPALDGIRAVALIAVLGYHSGFRDFRGGFLGVSTFFTLSGFLIATLAIAECTNTGRLSMARFWERRVRRLLPASLLTLALVLVLHATGGIGAGSGFNGDVLAALGYAANWRFVATGGDYGALFSEPSPILHFWSLAIEEQFYLLFPLIFAGLTALLGRRWRLVGAVFALGAVVSFSLAWWTAGRLGNGGLAYYGTHTRSGEVLVGVAAAYLITVPRVSRTLERRVVAAGLRWGALGALAGLAWLWHSHGLDDPGLFRGITALNAALTAWVVLAVLRPGPATLVLGASPLRSLGKISYGAYLFHWPIFLLFDHERTGLDPLPLFVLRIGVTLAAAVLSYRLIEAPFRTGMRMPSLRLAGLSTTCIVLLVGLTLALPERGSPRVDLTRGPDTVVIQQANEGVQNELGTVLLVGDSMAWSLIPGIKAWNDGQSNEDLRVASTVAFACPLTGPGEAAIFDRFSTLESCDLWHQNLDERLGAAPLPDAIVMFTGISDLNGRPVDGVWRGFGDPIFDAWFGDAIDDTADRLAAQGVPVLWLTVPHTRGIKPFSSAPWHEFELNDPARVDRFNEILHERLSGRPQFHVLDTSGWLRSAPGGEFDRVIRDDGVHLTEEGSMRAAEWLVPQIVDAVGGARPD